MLNRRSFIGGLSASLPLLALPGGSLRAQSAPRLHAMIVGINLYTGRGGDGQPIKSLRGCQNDAADIERQVRRFDPATLVRLGWDATRREEQPVTRALFLSTWEQVLRTASSGDRILLTYAGHGSRIPVLDGNPSGEVDGLDETLVLTGYDASQGRGGEHIIDDELGVMFQAARDKGVIVCFISDSCHSGTLTRSVDRLASDKTYRYVPTARDTGPVSVPPGKPPPILDNLVFIAGAQEDETVPEIRDPSTNLYRGALSLAVGRALAGEAPLTDGAITVRSLTVFVRRQVRLLAEGVQNADIIFPTISTERGVDSSTALFILPGKKPPEETKAPIKDASTPVGKRKVPLRIRGRTAADAQRIIGALRDAVEPGAGEAEALVWDAERRLVVNTQGHRIAENVGESDLQSVVDCRLALDDLIRQAADGLEVQVLIDGQDTRASDAVHKPGDKLTIKVTGHNVGDYLTVFNLSGRGMVELIEPTPYHITNPNLPDFKRPHFTTGRQARISEVSLGDVLVGEPFGADHVVAVAGPHPLRQLMAALVAAHKRHEIPSVMAGLAAERNAQKVKIGLRGIYTWRA